MKKPSEMTTREIKDEIFADMSTAARERELAEELHRRGVLARAGRSPEVNESNEEVVGGVRKASAVNAIEAVAAVVKRVAEHRGLGGIPAVTDAASAGAAADALSFHAQSDAAANKAALAARRIQWGKEYYPEAISLSQEAIDCAFGTGGVR